MVGQMRKHRPRPLVGMNRLDDLPQGATRALPEQGGHRQDTQSPETQPAEPRRVLFGTRVGIENGRG